jgi:hypothetical protein
MRVGRGLLRVLTGRLVLRRRKRVDIVFARTKDATAFVIGRGHKRPCSPSESVQPFGTLWRRHTPKSNCAWYVTKLCLLPIRLVDWAGESAMSPIVYNLGPGSIPLSRKDGGDILPVVRRRPVKQPACIAWTLYAVRLDDSEPRQTPAW